jgi:hypothetical protein
MALVLTTAPAAEPISLDEAKTNLSIDVNDAGDTNVRREGELCFAGPVWCRPCAFVTPRACSTSWASDLLALADSEGPFIRN